VKKRLTEKVRRSSIKASGRSSMNLNLKAQREQARPTFNRKRVFSAVNESNVRFEGYHKNQRRALAAKARALSVFDLNEPVCRS
jgi:hypothetical protein